MYSHQMVSSNWVIFLVVKYFTFISKGFEFELTFDMIRVFLWLFKINTQGN